MKALVLTVAALLLATPDVRAFAQRGEPPHGAIVEGRVIDVTSGRALPHVNISIEGTALSVFSDSAGHFRIAGAPSGIQTLVARRVGFAAARVSVVLTSDKITVSDIQLAQIALRMRQVRVTAEVQSRAQGELGTSSVISRDAIANQSATSVAGVLELLPGVPLQAPGLDNVQQVALRSVPTPSQFSERLAAFGTLVVLDGVPLSNNANLQSLGPRGEVSLHTAAGGGVDLRRIPAASLERVDVIRGMPSARYGDLTQGAIVIDTRAAIVRPEALARYDPRTAEGNFVFGRRTSLGTASMNADLARTLLLPGVRDGDVWRAAMDVAHRYVRTGGVRPDDADSAVAVVDSRANIYQLREDEPEQPAVRPGFFSTDRSGGVRVHERARLGAVNRPHVEVTASVQRDWQNARVQEMKVRGAQPFTDRLTAGRSVGHFVSGAYPALVRLEGSPWLLYGRAEAIRPWNAIGSATTLGGELRREWNGGAGYDFDVEFPPQTGFNGVNGFDRPRRYDQVPPIATSAVYASHRAVYIARGITTEVQGGGRVDVLHRGGTWTSGIRDAVLQPRLNAQIAPVPWLRALVGFGRTAKVPALSDLYPAPQYYDVVNVNWYPPDSAERLAVLTTSLLDPTNSRLAMTVARRLDATLEMDVPGGGILSVTGFRDRITGAVVYNTQPASLLREHFALTDSTIGTGRRPGYVVPAQSIDTVPVFLDRPENIARVQSAGVEATVGFPELEAFHTRLEMQAAWITTKATNNALDFGPTNRLTDFQLDSSKRRAPYWVGSVDRGERALTTLRAVHHQPELGLVVVGTLQYFFKEISRQEGAMDTLSWSGYVTRAGALLPVPPAQRLDAQYADLRRPRGTLLVEPRSPLPDWLLSLQMSKALAGGGRLSFFAFNAFDRIGHLETATRAGRPFARVRFGVELSMPVGNAGGVE